MSLRTKVVAYAEGAGVFWLLVGALAILSIFYMYSVNRAVVFVAERNSVQSKIQADNNDISGLESTYVSEKNRITLESAAALGYGRASETIYMPKKAVSVLARTETIQ